MEKLLYVSHILLLLFRINTQLLDLILRYIKHLRLIVILVEALSSQDDRSPTSFSDYTDRCFLSMTFLYPLMSHSEEVFFLHLNANNCF